jgi:hypothetical protein
MYTSLASDIESGHGATIHGGVAKINQEQLTAA